MKSPPPLDFSPPLGRVCEGSADSCHPGLNSHYLLFYAQRANSAPPRARNTPFFTHEKSVGHKMKVEIHKIDELYRIVVSKLRI
jgi:hypothetical protein